MNWFEKVIAIAGKNRPSETINEFKQQSTENADDAQNRNSVDPIMKLRKEDKSLENHTCMTCHCDMCGIAVVLGDTKKLLGKHFCVDCISKARSERRKRLAKAPEGKIREKEKQIREEQKQIREEQKRKEKTEQENRRNHIENMIRKLEESGPAPLTLPNIPFRLKRNEKVYFLAGEHSIKQFTIAFALTDFRFFFVSTRDSFQAHTGEISDLSITPGIKPISLSSIIAIDAPSCVSESSRESCIVLGNGKRVPLGSLSKVKGKVTIEIPLRLPESARSIRVHLNSGKDLSLLFAERLDADLCHSLLKEMVDRINDPIDDSVFSPKRERMADDIKVAVWRRDGGACVRCGGRERLEYDHIIPVSKGGSNTQRNIELLCEACNRMKSARIM